MEDGGDMASPGITRVNNEKPDSKTALTRTTAVTEVGLGSRTPSAGYDLLFGRRINTKLLRQG